MRINTNTFNRKERREDAEFLLNLDIKISLRDTRFAKPRERCHLSEVLVVVMFLL